MKISSRVRPLAVIHGAFFLASGLWPVFHMRSFEKLTGDKKDDWLVKTVGLLIATTGAALVHSGTRSQRPPRELTALAAGQSFWLGGVSLVYSLKGTISKIYLLDTLAEAALVAAWLTADSGRSGQTLVSEQDLSKSTAPVEGPRSIPGSPVSEAA